MANAGVPYTLSLELGDLIKKDNTWQNVQKSFTAPVVDGDLELKLSEVTAG